MIDAMHWWQTRWIALLRWLRALIERWLARLEQPAPTVGEVLDDVTPPAHWLAHVRKRAPDAEFIGRGTPMVQHPGERSRERGMPTAMGPASSGLTLSPPAHWLADVRRAQERSRTAATRRARGDTGVFRGLLQQMARLGAMWPGSRRAANSRRERYCRRLERFSSDPD